MRPGSVAWVDLGESVGREQQGRRPAVVVSSEDHLAVATSLVAVVPCTTVDRGWINHLRIDSESAGLDRATFAMTEQVRTVARGRLVGEVGSVSAASLGEITAWVHRWLAPPLESYPPRI